MKFSHNADDSRKLQPNLGKFGVYYHLLEVDYK